MPYKQQNNASIFYTRKFLAIGFTLFEFEAIIEFINKYSQIMEYLMVGDDDLVIAILHSLFALGLIRFLLLQFGFYMANQKLNKQIRLKRLNPIQFGSGFIFFTDWSIIQLYVFTNYLYGFQMPMVFFTSYIFYIYYKYIRIMMENDDYNGNKMLFV